MPKTIQVTYGRTVTDGNYGNRKIEIVMEPEEGETPEDCIKAAKTFVSLQIQCVEEGTMELPF